MRVFFRKINAVGALVSAVKFFVRKNKDRTFRQKVYALLNPTPYSGPLRRYIDQLIIWAVLVSVVCIVLETVPSIYAMFQYEFEILEVATFTLFVTEYIGRAYACRESPHYNEPVKGRLKYLSAFPR